MLATSRHARGEYAEAQAEAQRSIATLAEIGDIWNSAFALVSAGRIATTLGQFGKALEYATRGLGLARQIGSGRSAVLNLWTLSVVHQEMENHHDARQAGHEAIDLARIGEVGALLVWNLSSLALSEAALGRTDEAQAHLEEARQRLRGRQSRADYTHDLAHTEARVLLALGSTANALEDAKALLEEVAASEDQHWRTPAMLLLADAMFALGDRAAAVPLYGTVIEEAQVLGRTPVLWRALAGLGEAQRALGQVGESAASARRARGIIDRLTATVPDERLRTTFLQSTKVQRITALAGA